MIKIFTGWILTAKILFFASFRSKKAYLESIFGKFVFCKLPPIEPKFSKSFIKTLIKLKFNEYRNHIKLQNHLDKI